MLEPNGKQPSRRTVVYAFGKRWQRGLMLFYFTDPDAFKRRLVPLAERFLQEEPGETAGLGGERIQPGGKVRRDTGFGFLCFPPGVLQNGIGIYLLYQPGARSDSERPITSQAAAAYLLRAKTSARCS
jgi:hypothetical protein